MHIQHVIEIGTQHQLCSTEHTHAFILLPTCQEVAYTPGCLLFGSSYGKQGSTAYLAKVISVQVVPLVLILGGRRS